MTLVSRYFEERSELTKSTLDATRGRCSEAITHATCSRMHIFKLLVVPFLMVYASGCGCTEVGCSDGLTIELQKGSGTWEPGKYVFEVDLDGTKGKCTMDIPSNVDPVCSGSVQLDFKNKTPDTSPEELTPVSVQTFVAATHVTLTVTRDGAEVARKDFTPAYKVDEPNGEFCAPTCHNAADALPVP